MVSLDHIAAVFISLYHWVLGERMLAMIDITVQASHADAIDVQQYFFGIQMIECWVFF
ncbi:MAG: hypothetical protein ABI045_03990 [Flavobacteriales bacterium]